MILVCDVCSSVSLNITFTVEPSYCGQLCMEPGEVSCKEKCPHFRGKLRLGPTWKFPTFMHTTCMVSMANLDIRNTSMYYNNVILSCTK